MIAIDTNLVVRFITADDADQYARVQAVFACETVWLSRTVMLETEWILRSTYRYERRQVIAALLALAGMTGIALESPHQIAQAIDWCDKGMDFADAMHLAASSHCDAFITFDRALIAGASRSNIGPPVREP